MISRFHLALSLAVPIAFGIGLGVALGRFGLPNELFSRPEPLSPLGQTWGVTVPPNLSAKQTIGFLPYWLVKEINRLPPVTEVVYFSLELDEEGEIVKRQNPQEVELGWYTLQQESTQNLLDAFKRQGAGVTVAVTAFDNDRIDVLIHQSEVKQRAIETIAQAVQEYGFTGVNVDFEYVLSEPFQANSGLALAQFVKDLQVRLKKDNPQAKVSVDIYVNGMIYDEPYDVTALSRVADQVIVMAYDFHAPGSDRAGPVAPLRSDGQYRSIVEGIEAALEKKVALGKLVLGIPLYGYEWPTQTADFRALTLETGVLATSKRIGKLIQEEEVRLEWDQQSLSPWLWYETDGQIRQIYFDNDRSVSLKLQLADQLGLQGVAFWALGYEGENSSLWQVVAAWKQK